MEPALRSIGELLLNSTRRLVGNQQAAERRRR